VLGALISPVSWVHHLVWLVPAILMLLDAGRWRIALACYALLCSHLGWLWWDEQRSSWHGVLGSNLYVLVGLALLVLVPVEAPARSRREWTVSPPG
jgi:alpha-1,2-mannosyltransferase